MRIVIIGASPIAIRTAKLFTKDGHDVIVIEMNKELIEMFSEEIDCNFIHGDGTRPEVLRETDPKASDILFCLTNHDQINIISGLLGKSEGFKRVIVSITDDIWEKICCQLGLEQTILPGRIISQYLKDMGRGINVFELNEFIKGEISLFSFKVSKNEAGELQKLQLPQDAKAVWYYRKDKFFFVDEGTKIEEGDEIVIATHQKNREELNKRWKHADRKEYRRNCWTHKEDTPSADQ